MKLKDIIIYYLNFTDMKKILLFMTAFAVAMCMVSCDSFENKAKKQKSPEDIYAEKVIKFKTQAILGIEKYLKREVSVNPEIGEVIDTKDKILNDSLIFCEARILVQNVFGAKQQGDALFAVGKKDGKLYMRCWDNDIDFEIEMRVKSKYYNVQYDEYALFLYDEVCSYYGETEKIINDVTPVWRR